MNKRNTLIIVFALLMIALIARFDLPKFLESEQKLLAGETVTTQKNQHQLKCFLDEAEDESTKPKCEDYHLFAQIDLTEDFDGKKYIGKFYLRVFDNENYQTGNLIAEKEISRLDHFFESEDEISHETPFAIENNSEINFGFHEDFQNDLENPQYFLILNDLETGFSFEPEIALINSDNKLEINFIQ